MNIFNYVLLIMVLSGVKTSSAQAIATPPDMEHTNLRSINELKSFDSIAKLSDYVLNDQKRLYAMDQKSILCAWVRRKEMIAKLKTLSAKELESLYNVLPQEALAFRYACLLQCAYQFNIDLNPKIKANLFFRYISLLINFPDNNYQNVANSGFYTPLFDQEHIYHVLPFLEHIVGKKIKRLNLAKSNIKQLPITMLQLPELELIVCKDDVRKSFKEMPDLALPWRWDFRFYTLPMAGVQTAKL